MVFLHGGGRTLADWAAVVPLVADDVRMVTVDFRGHGCSDDVASFSFENGVRDAGGVVDALGLDRPIIVGHSLGGMIASIYAATSGVCAGLVNVDGHGTGHPSQFDGIPEDEVAAALDHFADLSVTSFESIVQTGDAAWVEAEIAEFVDMATKAGYAADVADTVIRRGFRPTADGQWRMSPSSAVNSSMYVSFRGLDMPSYYRALACPSIIIDTNGDAEEEEDPEMALLLRAHGIGLRRQLREVADENPNIELRTFKTGHMVMWDAPQELATLLIEFAQRVP